MRYSVLAILLVAVLIAVSVLAFATLVINGVHAVFP